MSHEAGELLRRATEARARAEASVAYERERRERLEPSRAELERQAPPGRRLLARLIGSSAWDAVARRVSARSRPDVPGDAPADERTRIERALAEREQLRRSNDRLERRLRTLELGFGELARAARSPLAVRGRALPLPRIGAVSIPGGGAVTVVITGPRVRALPAVLRALRDRPARVVLTGDRHGFGSRAARAITAARTGVVVVCEPRAVSSWASVAGELERAPGVGAAGPPWAFDWVDSGSVPVPAPGTPAAIGGPCVALRPAALAGVEPCGDYRGGGWGLDLSLALRERGVPVGAAVGQPGGGLPAGDQALLRRRFGPALRRAILGDLLAGGGDWCARTLRVDGMPAPTRDALGWEDGRGAPDAVIEIGDARVRVDWTPGCPGAAATVAPAGAEPAAIRDAVERSLDAPSFAVRVGARDRESARAGGDLQLAEALCGALARRGHHAAVQVASEDDDGWARSLDVLVNVRGRRAAPLGPGQLNVVWLVSHPRDAPDAELGEYDLVLVASRPHAAVLRERLEVPVVGLLQFTDPDRFFPEAASEDAHELLFVGNWRSTLRPIVWDAVQEGFRPALYGAGWERVFPELVVNEHVSQMEVRKLYSSCSVLLCDHWEDMRDLGFVSNRVFDALACETFVVSDDCAGLGELFGDAVEIYRGAGDLRATLERVLADPGERIERAARGRETVLELHTADRRAAELVEALLLARRRPPRL